jgi:hypothetical protein
MPLFEGRIGGSSFKEVPEGSIKMAEGLLQRNTGNLIQPSILRLPLQLCQQSRGVAVVEPFLLLVVGITPQPQGPIIHETSTPKGLSKYFLLLNSGIPSILVGSLLFHILQYTTYHMRRTYAQRKKMTRTSRYQKMPWAAFSPVLIYSIMLKQGKMNTRFSQMGTA